MQHLSQETLVTESLHKTFSSPVADGNLVLIAQVHVLPQKHGRSVEIGRHRRWTIFRFTSGCLSLFSSGRLLVVTLLWLGTPLKNDEIFRGRGFEGFLILASGIAGAFHRRPSRVDRLLGNVGR